MGRHPIIWDGTNGLIVAVKTPYVQRDQAHYAVQSLDRAIDLLDAFGSGDDERGVADLARELDLPRATVHRLLAALCHRRLLAHDQVTGKYRLGLKLFELGSIVGSSLDVGRVAHPHLVSLARDTGETAHLVILDGVDVVFVDKVETDNPFRMVSQIGRRLPARHSGSGKALLARLPPDELLRRFAVVSFDTGESFPLEPLLERLTEIRRQRWAIDDEETQLGLRCVGTTIDNHTSHAIAGLSVSGPIARITTNRIAELAAIVCATADQISRALGYKAISVPRDGV
jgi:IclR family KDG regulon transcriptional repressor